MERIANDSMFGMSLEELKNIMDPKNFVGRAPQQTEEYVQGYVMPLIEANKDSLENEGDEIRV